MHFCEIDQSFKAYKVSGHRHTSEIEQEISKAAGQEIVINFTPHLLPVKRGILETIYAKLKNGVTAQQIAQAYKKYDDEQFISVLTDGATPELKSVTGSNSFICGYVVNKRTNTMSLNEK